MRQRKIPMRKCNGCGEMKPKKELVRIVKSPDQKDEGGNVIKRGDVSLDLTGKMSGRGAYICKSAQCLSLARKARRFERAFSCKIPEEVFDELERQLDRHE